MDSIANSFVQIKNALQISKKEVLISYSKIKLAILETLKKQNLINDYEEIKTDEQKYPKIKVSLKYRNHEPAIRDLRRISRPGRRVYANAAKLSVLLRGRLDLILSTSQGVMSGREARQKGLGGEVIGEVV